MSRVITVEAYYHQTLNLDLSHLNIDYDDIITGDTGHSIGEVLLRYVATHLTGHPLGQAIIRNDQDFKQQVDNQTQNSKIANTRANAVKAFSPPDSCDIDEFFLPGGLATIPTPEVNKSSPRSISSA